MRYAGTELFKTVHPMTYLFVIHSITWGFVLFYELFAVSDATNLSAMFWPLIVAYAWAAMVVVAGLIILWFFYRDRDDKSRERIWTMAKANSAIWVFATLVWFFLGEFSIIIFSIVNIIGFAYIGFTDMFPSDKRRL